MHIVFREGVEVVVPLPEDQMVVSVASYLAHTHPCAAHTMSSCQGELVEVPVQVKVSSQDGSIILDEVMTLPNGFIDLWLPRDQVLYLQLHLDGYYARGVITTLVASNTCVTTFGSLAPHTSTRDATPSGVDVSWSHLP